MDFQTLYELERARCESLLATLASVRAYILRGGRDERMDAIVARIIHDVLPRDE